MAVRAPWKPGMSVRRTVTPAMGVFAVAGQDWGLAGKVCIVTGGGRGLGRSLALKLAAIGAKVSVVSRTATELEAVASEARRLSEDVRSGGEVFTFAGDVARPETAAKVVDSTLGRWGTIDVLINNAGVMIRKPCVELAFEDWQRTIGTNLTGYFLFAQAAGRVMISNRRGKVVNIGSELAVMGSATGQVGYCSSKGGIVQLTRCLAVEWAQYGVNVNCVAPGAFRTTLEDGLNDPEFVKYLSSKIPLGRIPEPDEIADVVLFMASPYSDYITGHVLMVEGGITVA